jgi:hypothetical protein
MSGGGQNRSSGSAKKTLKSGLKVRLKNKGSQAHKRGPKRPKYQAPQPEHPETNQDLDNQQIHANHLEAFNSALRRRMACYRRQTNTYAKEQPALQGRLDAYWVLHNFIRPHFTTKQVPAVALGIVDHPLSWHEIFRIQYIRADAT